MGGEGSGRKANPLNVYTPTRLGVVSIDNSQIELPNVSAVKEGDRIIQRQNVSGAGWVFNDAQGVMYLGGTPPGAAGSGHTIQDEGVPLTQRTNLNFSGAAVTIKDDLGNDATIVSVTTTGSETDPLWMSMSGAYMLLSQSGSLAYVTTSQSGSLAYVTLAQSGGLSYVTLAQSGGLAYLKDTGDTGTGDYHFDAMTLSGAFVGIGTTIPDKYLTVQGTSASNWVSQIINEGNSADLGFLVNSNAQTYHSGNFVASRGRGTLASPTYPNAGDALFSISVGGYAGTMSTNNTFRMTFLAENNFGATSATGKMTLTCNDGSTNWNGGAVKLITTRTNGYIGFGTDNPLAKIHVSGAEVLTNASPVAVSTNEGCIFLSGGALYFRGGAGTQTQVAVA